MAAILTDQRQDLVGPHAVRMSVLVPTDLGTVLCPLDRGNEPWGHVVLGEVGGPSGLGRARLGVSTPRGSVFNPRGPRLHPLPRGWSAYPQG